MKLNLDAKDITLENYNEIIAEINSFKKKANDIYEGLKKEKGKELIKSRLSEAIEGIEKCEIYGVERGDLQRIFYEYISSMGFDGYGDYDKEDLEDSTYENDVFMLRPYSWSDSDCSCGLDEEEADVYYENEKNGVKDDVALGFHAISCYNCYDRVVNFWYKPTNLKIHWYKYPFRSASANQDITLEYLEAVMTHCKESMENSKLK